MTVPLSKIMISLDSSAINPKDKLEQIAFNRILDWRNVGVILDIMPSVQEEIYHPHTPLEIKRWVNTLGYTQIESNLTTEEKNCFAQIRKILAGNGAVDKVHADAKHVFHSYKNAVDYFVTLDKGILKKREPLHNICSCSLTILRPSELVEK